MLRRPPTRSIAKTVQSTETKFASQLAEFTTSGTITDEQTQLPHGLAPPDSDQLPDFLTSDAVIVPEPDALVIEERWDQPFASGTALSDRVMAAAALPDFIVGEGMTIDTPPTNLPVGALRRRGTRSVR